MVAVVGPILHVTYGAMLVGAMLAGAAGTAAALALGGRRRWRTVAQDATRRHEELERSVAEAVASQSRLARIIEATPDVVFLAAPPDGRCLYMNRAGRRLLQFGDDEDLSTLLLTTVHPAATRVEITETMIPAALRDGVWEGPSTLLARDGREIPVSLAFIAHRLPDGTPQFSAIMRDMTRRYELETQLRQAQKMEAVGRLAGGVAHDFNNMLSVILANADLLGLDVAAGTSEPDCLREIRGAALRAADLTRQLLAFSRQQVLEPRVLSPNDVIGGVEKMLRRLISENITIVMALSPTVSRIKADPGQLEQVILNLAVNARDAMPAGGRLTFETADINLDEPYVATHPNVTAGPYVMLAVSDTGTGMDKATQARIFEPFFTTKEQGKGTGLGLATVYGIVKQSGGYIWAYSEPHRGSTFKIYLPSIGRAIDPAEPSPRVAQPARGRETILFVEDDPSLRSAGAEILGRHGYTVLVAGSGDEAVARFRDNADAIDLVATDVVMPGLTGPETVERLRAAYPHVKVLFMSGYTDATVMEHGVSTVGASFLQKPFGIATLTQKVRDVLDGRPGNPTAPEFGRARW
jgi:two-component system, cell cycle sensor histidine kinase and response regulator CckA